MEEVDTVLGFSFRSHLKSAVNLRIRISTKTPIKVRVTAPGTSPNILVKIAAKIKVSSVPNGTTLVGVTEECSFRMATPKKRGTRQIRVAQGTRGVITKPASAPPPAVFPLPP